MNRLLCMVEKNEPNGSRMGSKWVRLEKIGGVEIANTVTTHQPSFDIQHCNMVIEVEEMEKIIVAMRGRDKTNPNHRGKANENYEQVLEPNAEGIANAITTVQKDNLVCELTVGVKQATKEGVIPCDVRGIADLSYPDSNTRRGRVQGNGHICPTLTTENVPNVLEPWLWEIDGTIYRIRIRKLTPKEYWRIMDFSDEDFDKAAAVNSNSQLYKQAGNSIVKNVLCEVFKQMM